MGEILRSQNGNAIVLTPRSGSHSLSLAALQSFWSDSYQEYIKDPYNKHPAWFFPVHEQYVDSPEGVGIVVRNPIERFRSMVAHETNKSLIEHLSNPVYGPLPKGNFVKYFLFESQLQECADWLGVTVSLEQIAATEPISKPVLTLEQEIVVRQIYIDDIILWESLQNKEI